MGVNDVPGPGPNTNTGPGSNYSSEEKPTNSGQYDSYEDYRDDVSEIGEINEQQRTGEDDNKPSDPAPSSDYQERNNGDTGNERDGSAPINEPTPTAPPVHVENPDGSQTPVANSGNDTPDPNDGGGAAPAPYFDPTQAAGGDLSGGDADPTTFNNAETDESFWTEANPDYDPNAGEDLGFLGSQ